MEIRFTYETKYGAFSVLGVTWTESEILELNTILENNNFTIRL